MTVRLLSSDMRTVERNDDALRHSQIIKFKKKFYMFRLTKADGELWYVEETPAVLE